MRLRPLKISGSILNVYLSLEELQKNPAVGQIASALFGRPVLIPPAGEYVADGAAKQAAWALLGGATPPEWDLGKATHIEAAATPEVLEKYRTLRDATINW